MGFIQAVKFVTGQRLPHIKSKEDDKVEENIC